jgi:hypothetical protein
MHAFVYYILLTNEKKNIFEADGSVSCKMSAIIYYYIILSNK